MDKSVRSEGIHEIGENGNEVWQWEGQDYCLEKDSNLDISECLWDGVPQNEEDLSYMFDETTPVKACGDLAYHIADSGCMNKETEGKETSSQVKRRRMLQFNPQEREIFVEEALPETSQWVSTFPENMSASGYEGLDPTSESWLAKCFNDTEMLFGADDMSSAPEVSDVQIDVTEFCNIPTEYEVNMVQETATRTPRNIIFKGRKSYIRTPTKLASSVAYPFAFIKPCGVHGDVTLKDINQRIRTPPPSKSKQGDEDPSVSYPTSAFSGKPVVGKTKIRTEGGKGSITIMRTKG